MDTWAVMVKGGKSEQMRSVSLDFIGLHHGSRTEGQDGGCCKKKTIRLHHRMHTHTHTHTQSDVYHAQRLMCGTGTSVLLCRPFPVALIQSLVDPHLVVVPVLLGLIGVSARSSTNTTHPQQHHQHR